MSNRGKERAAASFIADTYKKKYPEATTTDALFGIREYFKNAIKINNTFLWNSMSLPFLVSQFNQINSILKNGKNTKQPATTDREIAEIVIGIDRTKH